MSSARAQADLFVRLARVLWSSPKSRLSATRFDVQYNYLDGQYNGIGFLRDRDNVIIQLEAVI